MINDINILQLLSTRIVDFHELIHSGYYTSIRENN